MQPMYSSLLSLLENEERNSRNEYICYLSAIYISQGRLSATDFLLESATKQGRARLKLNLTNQGK